MQAIKRLRDRGILPRSDTVSVRDLNQRFQPVPSGSMRSLLLKMNTLADVAKPVGGSTHPYYRRSMPAPQKVGDFASDTTHIDLTNAHMPAYPSEPVELSAFNSLFDARAAAAVSDATGFSRRVRIFPSDSLDNPEEVLLEFKFYGDEAPKIYIPTAKCLAAMAYPDYFPEANADYLRCMVSAAILVARPGWCGTFGPGVEPTDLLGHFETGDYDMSQMHLLPIAYRYYDELFPEAREHLITQLLGAGRIHRVGLDDTLTHGGMPNDWNRAGIIDELTLNIRTEASG